MIHILNIRSCLDTCMIRSPPRRPIHNPIIVKARTNEPCCPSIAALKSLSLVPHGDSGSCILFPYDEALYIRLPYLPQELCLVSSLFSCQVGDESIRDSKIISKSESIWVVPNHGSESWFRVTCSVPNAKKTPG